MRITGLELEFRMLKVLDGILRDLELIKILGLVERDEQLERIQDGSQIFFF